jgi:transcriptional regulator with XRE-family HTH domain
VYVVMDGPEVRAMRQERGLSRRELAELSGLAPSTLWRAEEGLSAVQLSTARKLAGALGANPKRLGRPLAREEE